MAKSLITQITDCIERVLEMGGNSQHKIILFPCGDIGIQTYNIMKNIYAVEPALLIDNHKSKYTDNIHALSHLENINTDEYVLFLTSNNTNIYDDLKNSVSKYFSQEKIIELECMTKINNSKFSGKSKYCQYKTEIGRYSYGPLCYNHRLIKSIGSFCSFAHGVDYVPNHEIRYITTHPFIYCGKNTEGYEYPFELDKDEDYYMPGVEPKTEFIKKQQRATIGNDVWLGKDVLVTNSANIGNGVIAAAGAVITKDVPDYAVVAGIPARIIRYRYTPEQITALNKIAWWNWTDDEIKERYDDFYLPIELFIEKYQQID
ncbi:MAG: CatB-related O-acetyltransferase [Lachnospiraceae bacterium]|nr:CatB-related O-acetyltransferase [Lachnospiraceae bacterium]